MDFIILAGLVSSVALVGMSLANDRRTVTWWILGLTLATSVQFALLEKWALVAINGVAIVYAIASAFERYIPFIQKTPGKLGLFIAYSGAFFAVNGFHWDIELLSYFAAITSIAMMVISNPLTNKLFALTNGISWSIYQAIVGAYGQLPGQAFYTKTRIKRRNL